MQRARRARREADFDHPASVGLSSGRDGILARNSSPPKRLVRRFPPQRPREAAGRDAGVAITTNRVGGMFGLFFSDEPVDTYAQAIACDTAAFNRFFHAMLERGVYLAPSAFEAGFMSAAHGDAEIARTLAAARESFRIVRG